MLTGPAAALNDACPGVETRSAEMAPLATIHPRCDALSGGGVLRRRASDLHPPDLRPLLQISP